MKLSPGFSAKLAESIEAVKAKRPWDGLAIIQGDARQIPLADETVQCVVTSPPYWGLRKYAGAQDLIWCGANDCEHEWTTGTVTANENTPSASNKLNGGRGAKVGGKYGPRLQTGGTGPASAKQSTHRGNSGEEFTGASDICVKCGAWYGGFGLEPTIEMYIAHTVEILREIRRVLCPDGVVFWNIGDSYCHGQPGGGSVFDNGRTDGRASYKADKARGREKVNTLSPGLKPKDLCLIPARVAIAAQADGWWVRSMIIWAKPNPMPESCTDRPTDAYEHILMLTKSERYFWDADGVREPSTGNTHLRGNGDGGPKARERADEGTFEGWTDGTREMLPQRNLRNVWTFPTQPYPGAHFATFPEEIPRRCILAATSERGACVHCGAPWQRVVKATGGTIGKGYHDHSADNERGQRMGATAPESTDGTYHRETIGWEPTCECATQGEIDCHPRPCIVLDPFGGSGTTARVAVELNRRAVSLDLAYHDHAKERTRNVQRTLAAL